MSCSKSSGSAICGTDSSEWSHGPLLTRPPVILGHEFVGRVVAIGDEVTDLALGDRVVSGAGVSCGHCEWCRAGRTNLCSTYLTLGLQLNGGLAERVADAGGHLPSRSGRLHGRCGGNGAAVRGRPPRGAPQRLFNPAKRASSSAWAASAPSSSRLRRPKGISPLIAVDIDEGRLETARPAGRRSRPRREKGRDLAPADPRRNAAAKAPTS